MLREVWALSGKERNQSGDSSESANRFAQIRPSKPWDPAPTNPTVTLETTRQDPLPRSCDPAHLPENVEL